MQRSPEVETLVSKTVSDFEQDLRTHKPQADIYDQRYRAYRGVIEARSPAAAWTNKNHPQVALQNIETMVANLIDPSPKWRLRAKPLIADPSEVARMREGARANELLLSHQLTLDKYAEKQRPFDLQALICGITASKQRWLEKKGPRRYLETVEEPVHGFLGRQIGTVPRLYQRRDESFLYRDDPTSEVVDVRHLIFPENATSMEKLPRLAHRMYFDYDELEELERDGYYGPKAGGESCKELKESRGFTDGEHNREQDLFGVKVAKDKIEVVEHWIERGRRVVTIANRKVLLADKRNPFWFDHLDHLFPFVVCSSMPDLFRIPGISEVELMMELQEMLWTLMNQRLDSLQLLSNAIFLIADDVDDPDAFEFAPGERWLVPRPVEETVKSWSPDATVPRMTLEAEALIRGDIQNLAGAGILAGSDSQTIDQNTATGVSIVTTLAQKRMAAKKQQFFWAKSRIGEQLCALNQQFIRSERLVPMVGAEGAQDFMAIRPDLIQGIYLFETEMVDDSLMTSQRRAEAQAKLQVASGVVGIFAELSQVPGAGTPALNMKAFMDDYLDAFDITDKERYYVAVPTPVPQSGPVPPGQPGAQANGNGVTNPALAAGPQSPSNPASMSPEVFAARAISETGGVVNQ